MKNIRKIVIALICICSVGLFIVIAIMSKGNNYIFDVVLQDEIENIEDLCAYYDIEYISEEEIADFEFVKQVFLKFPYDTQSEGKSTKNYYESVIYALAKIYKYKDIIVLDDEKALKIEIESNETTENVDSYTINGDKNYFVNLESKLNLAKITNIELKEMNVENEVLKKLISSNWSADSINFGTKDSDLAEYEIYFDEGLQVRKIAGKVFNIVFTEKYTGNIIENISVKTNLNEVISKYGNTSFNEHDGILGYKTKDFYIFFSNDQISIYRTEAYETKEFANLVTTFIDTEDEKKFKDSLKQLWPDYDYFSENELTGEIELTYTLKGIKFNINKSREQGLTLYTNFNGQVVNNISFNQIINKEEEIPDYVYIKTEDLVYLNEVSRAYDIYNHKITVENYTYMYNDAIDKDLDMYYDNTWSDFSNPSSKFFCIKDGSTVRVFSYDNTYAPMEIKKNYCILWADDTHLIYSRNKQGIYVYDAVSRKTETIVSGSGEYKIVTYENGILKYDNENIEINLK